MGPGSMWLGSQPAGGAGDDWSTSAGAAKCCHRRASPGAARSFREPHRHSPGEAVCVSGSDLLRLTGEVKCAADPEACGSQKRPGGS